MFIVLWCPVKWCKMYILKKRRIILLQLCVLIILLNNHPTSSTTWVWMLHISAYISGRGCSRWPHTTHTYVGLDVDPVLRCHERCIVLGRQANAYFGNIGGTNILAFVAKGARCCTMKIHDSMIKCNQRHSFHCSIYARTQSYNLAFELAN